MDDKITIERIKLMHPNLVGKTLADYRAANAVLGKGVRLRFSRTFATFEDQHKIFLQRPKVTDADAGQSYHNYGLAFDKCLLYDKNLDGNFEEVSWDRLRDGDKDHTPDWMEVTNVLVSRGWQNGFVKSGKKWDLPHYQITFGLHWSELLKRYKAGDFVKGRYVKLC